MDAETFVRQLAELAPESSEVERCGLTGAQACEVIASYRCVKLDHPLTEPIGTDPTLELIRNWDLRRIAIGLVRFADFHTAPSGAFRIGCVEADPLVMLSTGEIVVLELGTRDHILWRAAENSSGFLEALIVAARFLERPGIGVIDFDDFEGARIVSLECAAAAGGGRYLDFYTMLLR